uniref:Uncharacterized protein n=1 Tax=Parascaris equorum TaxID=6256 RepID=A0A914S229_PAREQ
MHTTIISCSTYLIVEVHLLRFFAKTAVPEVENTSIFAAISITKFYRHSNLTKLPYRLNYYIKENLRKYVSASCVFGVDDVSSLLQRPHLVAHKFYLDFQPAAFFCVYQKVRERALHDIRQFNDAPYGDLPGPRMERGESVEEWFNATLFLS